MGKSCNVGQNNPMFGVHKKGKKASFYGKHHTKKWKEEQSKRMIGNKNPAKRPEVRKKLSLNRANIWGKNNPNFGNHKLAGKNHPNYGKPFPHGNGTHYKGNYMRSSWEVSFAQFLDLSNIKWIYEPKRFYFEDCTYLPDFYLPKFDCYIEIKGYWRPNTKKRFDLFRKNYPKINIKLLMQNELEELGTI